MKKFYMIVLCLLLASHSVAGQTNIDSLQTVIKNDQQNIDAMINLGIAYHDLGVHGDKKSVDKGADLFERVLDLDSTNAVGLAYLGSIYSLRARDTFMPWNKLKHTKRATKLLDHPAVTGSRDLDVHLIRAMNSYEIPKFLNRLEIAIEEFEFIVNHQNFSDWPSPKRSFVLLQTGRAYKKDGNESAAGKYFQLAIDEAPDSVYAKYAEKELKK